MVDARGWMADHETVDRQGERKRVQEFGRGVWLWLLLSLTVGYGGHPLIQEIETRALEPDVMVQPRHYDRLSQESLYRPVMNACLQSLHSAGPEHSEWDGGMENLTARSGENGGVGQVTQ